jgi:hypothetical protein
MEDTSRRTSAFPATPRRQFTLAGMLSYGLAVGVYCSMLSSLRPLLSREYWDFGRSSIGTIYLTVPTAWCVLWWLYRRWRLPQALRVHLAGPVIAIAILGVGLCLGIMFGLFALAQSPRDFSQTGLERVGDIFKVVSDALIYACGISTAVSLPAATLMLLYLMLRPAAPSVANALRGVPERPKNVAEPGNLGGTPQRAFATDRGPCPNDHE